MTDAEAADIFERFHREQLPARVKEFEDAKRVLRRRFQKKGTALYRRTIACARRSARRFSQTKALELGYLTEEQIEAARVENEQLVLSYVGPTE
ncbi:hypothetical protein [Euzebya rosea]|uniref:hypothetical protein n=1 Tax=Euzebya rosea TaxID=2052804 RepID=UPI000D3EA50A|nr:hypothetical protein [Euzebya rosea]